jgi:hypothetical protein
VAATGWLHLSQVERGLATARRALAAADSAADPTARCLALGPLGKGLLLTGRWAEAEAVLEEAVTLARRSDDPLVHFGPCISTTSRPRCSTAASTGPWC